MYVFIVLFFKFSDSMKRSANVFIKNRRMHSAILVPHGLDFQRSNHTLMMKQQIMITWKTMGYIQATNLAFSGIRKGVVNHHPHGGTNERPARAEELLERKIPMIKQRVRLYLFISYGIIILSPPRRFCFWSCLFAFLFVCLFLRSFVRQQD